MPRAKAAARRKASFAVPGLLVARGTAGIRKAGPELTDSAWIGEGRSSVDLWDEGAAQRIARTIEGVARRLERG